MSSPFAGMDVVGVRLYLAEVLKSIIDMSGHFLFTERAFLCQWSVFRALPYDG